MVHRLLFLQPDDFRRLAPYFGLYFAVFLMLAISDGVSLSLFVQRMGAERLPFYYGVTAVMNMAVMGVYLVLIARLSNLAMFRLILILTMLTFLGVWLAVGAAGDTYHHPVYGLLFASREIAFTLVLMHFGTFLQDYFTRSELDRMLPIIYTGGRLGGMAGGALLGFFGQILGMLNFLPLAAGMAGLCLYLLRRMETLPFAPDTPTGNGPENRWANLWPQMLRSRLMIWFFLSTFIFIICRWILNFEYNRYFENHFADADQMGVFLGWYMTAAMAVSLIVQLFFVNRLTAAIGLRGCLLLYTLLMAGTLSVNLLPPVLAIAVFSRFIETEFRIGFRNPIAMLITNRFEKAWRKQARAISMGMVIPLGTLVTSILLTWAGYEVPEFVPWLGAGMGLAYLAATFGLAAQLDAAPQEATPQRIKG